MASTDQYIDTDCKLLLHMDGSDASTTFTDSELNTPKTVTANADAQIDTAQSVFGGASGLFDGAGDYLNIADSSDFDLSNGDFTADFRLRLASLSSVTGYQAFFGQWDSVADNGYIALFHNNASTYTLEFFYTTDGSSSNVASFSFSAVAIDTWYHIAFVRSGSNLYCFVDGTQVGSTYNISTSTIYNSTSDFVIGADDNAAHLYPINGWIDELRIVKGTAVWTSNFTPPSAAYTVAPSTNSNFLMFFN